MATTRPRRHLALLLLLGAVPGLACQSSKPKEASVPASTTAPAPTVPGLPLVNARTCKRVPKSAFAGAGGGKIIEVDDQTGSGAWQQVQYLSSSCTFGLDDGKTVTVAALFDQQSAQALGKAGFERWRNSVVDPTEAQHADDQSNGPGDATFWLTGGLTDTLVVLDGEQVFTVEATKKGVSLERPAVEKFADAALMALDR